MKYDFQFDMTVSKAIEAGDIDKVKELLSDEDKFNLIIPRGNWLNIAAGSQQLEIIRYLLDRGIDRNLVARTGNSLVNAARTGNIEILDYLIQNGVKLNCDRGELNPLFQAVQFNRVSAVEYLLEKEKAFLSPAEYEELIDLLKKKALVHSHNKEMLAYFGIVFPERKNTRLNKADKENIIRLLKQDIQKSFSVIKEKCMGEKLYILSFQTMENLSEIYLYMNTEENLLRQLDEADEEGKKDVYYYRYCEDEWDMLEDAPNYFQEVSEYMKKQQITNEDNAKWYALIVNALCELREEKYFEQEYPSELLLTIYGHEAYSQKEQIAFFKKLNKGMDDNGYIKNIERFF